MTSKNITIDGNIVSHVVDRTTLQTGDLYVFSNAYSSVEIWTLYVGFAAFSLFLVLVVVARVLDRLYYAKIVLGIRVNQLAIITVAMLKLFILVLKLVIDLLIGSKELLFSVKELFFVIKFIFLVENSYHYRIRSLLI